MKLLPFFVDHFDDDSKANYRAICKRASEFLGELLKYSDEVFEFCMSIASGRNRPADDTLRGMVRHNMAYLDSVSVLLGSGCVESCEPLLRSILEATLGIGHIVEEKPDERALAYQLARIKRKIKFLQRGDRSHQVGRQLEAELATDEFSPGIHAHLPTDLGARAAKIESDLNAEAKFAPILLEWDRVKRQKDPEWYTLFGAARDIRSLAIQLKWQSLYDFPYRDWSNSVHAGNALDKVLTRNGALRPLRYPADYAKAFSFAYALTTQGLERFAAFYDGAKRQEVMDIVVRIFEPERQKIEKQIEHGVGEFR